eukprot:TRINITY_DN69233_c0_g1_i1.p1 TRINITY_DN69233_c0_g1~~TRINITY_DN69233_c0_g1_i1.p1  ORF type:complete len:163 (-),score=29.88 TRINITY_DN69233_c0_g1_i1:75-500(-)
MSAQAKLPRVTYSTNFDRFASACQVLFLSIVIGCMAASFTVNVPSWLSPCAVGKKIWSSAGVVRELEDYLNLSMLLLWVSWNARFAWSSWVTQRLEPLRALRSLVAVRLQDTERVLKGAPASVDLDSFEARVSEEAPQSSV